MILSLIAAISENNVIGAGNKLIWKLKDDTAFFMRTTLGHTVIMGRRTFDSMGTPLKSRRNLVITRNKELRIEGAETYESLEYALIAAAPGANEELFVIGGAEIYRMALPLANRLYLTRVHATVSGDTYFPVVHWSDWSAVSHKEAFKDQRNEFAASYFVYERWN